MKLQPAQQLRTELGLIAAAAVLLFSLSARAYQADPKDDIYFARATDSVAAASVVQVSPDQRVAAGLATQAGLTVEWQPRLGKPLAVRGANLAVRAGFSGGKGLAPGPNASIEQHAIAVLDNLSRLYQVQDAQSEFSVKRIDSDELGFRHVRLSQVHRGLRVIGGDLIVHFDQLGNPYQVSGDHTPNISLDTTPRLVANEGVPLALRWLADAGKSNAIPEAAATLVILARNQPPTLAYELTLRATNPGGGEDRWRCWLDANSGQVLLCYNDIKKIAPPSANGIQSAITGNLLSSEGGQSVSVTGWFENTGLYYLRNTNRQWTIYNVATSGWPDNSTYAYRASSAWGTSDRAEISLARNFDFIQQYFREVHGRNSFNNVGIVALANAHEGINYVNAYWNGSAFYFGDGNGVVANPLATLDISAHEYAHAVTDYTADLMYSFESGALNESFSDIFGACVEFYHQADGRALYPGKSPGQADWLCGEDCWISSPALRDMRNPRNTATVGAGNEQPSRYKGTYWYSGSGDNGGVHINSGVQNFFFYLLCEGGTGNNDGISYSVTGIGVTNAAQVAYRALTVYCTPNTDYRAARAAWVAAALDLNPVWATSVAHAWSAVGVSALSITPDGELTFRGPVGGPFTPVLQNFTLQNTSAGPMNWGVTANAAWLNISPSSGTIPVGGSQLVAVSLNSQANLFPAAVYTNTLTFTNEVEASSQPRSLRFLVGQPEYYTELFDTSPNDLAYNTFTFTPDGSVSHYSLCRETAAAFPTDPAGGAMVSLSDDSFAAVTLSGANTVAIYNRRTNVIFIGSNGYLTMNSGDSSLGESFASHFNLPRVSGCFDDLNPASGGTVSWKQTSELVAVTFANVREFGSTATVNFQIELFFDGRIRVTYLGMGVTDGLAGLSAGLGVPAGFSESDLTSYPLCPPPDILSIVPKSGFIAQGAPGGPFNPALATYTLSNASPVALTWSVSHTQSWLGVSPSSGTLASGQSANVLFSILASANSLPGGQYSDSVAFSNHTSGVVQRRPVLLNVQIPPPTLAEATDTPGAVWSTGGSAVWIGQRVNTHDGVDAAESGTISHSQETWMETTVSGPGTLTFWWSVSSESGFDYLEFRINGNLNSRISGIVGWTFRTVAISSGSQTLRWRYMKDGSANSGQDKGWVDEVVFVPAGPTPPFIVTHPQNTIVAVGSDAGFSVTAAGSTPLRYQWRSTCGQLPNATNATLTLPGVNTNQSGCTYWVEVTNAFGAVTSSVATLMVVQPGDFYDDFEPNLDLIQWSAFGGVPGSTVLATNYGGYVSSPNSLWFGAAGSRFAASRDLNTSLGGVVDFWLRIASGTSSTWETADLPGEGIVLEYSINGGTTWTEMARYTDSVFTSWTHLAQEIPQAAQSPQTRFQWRQLANSGTGFDHWALDNVTALIGPTPPAIVTQPANRSIFPGASATFCAAATGSSPLSYQWQKDGANLVDGVRITGATGPCLSISGALEGDSGLYRVLVTNLYGTAISSNAVLLVSELHHFTWSPISSPQPAGVPFPVSVTARNQANNLVSNYTGSVSLAGFSGVVSTTLFAEDFEDGDYAGWVNGSGSYLRAVTNETAAAGNYSLTLIGGNQDHYNGVSRTLGNLQPAQCEFYVRSSTTNLACGYVILGNGPSIEAAVWFYMNDQGRLTLVGPGTTTYTNPYTANTWYKNTFRFNWSARRVDWYVNDAVVVTNVPFRGPSVSNLTYIALYNFHAGSRAWWDEIRMSDGALPIPVSVAPGQSGSFVNGAWTGNITVQSPNTNVFLRAADEFGHIGHSDSFDVVPMPPSILVHPTNLTAQIGNAATFCVTARGTPPLGYYWLRDGKLISGLGQPCYTLLNAEFADSGSQFSCLVSNAYGSVASSSALLTVNRPPVADASATTSIVIATNSTDARAVLNAARSFDPDGDPLHYLWFRTNLAAPLATGMVTVVVLPVGSHPLDLVVSDGMVTGTDRVTVGVLTPGQAVSGIITQIQLSGWTPTRQLLAILDAAQAAFERGNEIAAINQLHAFQLMVRAQIAPSDPALAESLIRAAQRIMDAYCDSGLAIFRPQLNVLEQTPGGRIRFKVNGVACRLQLVEASINMVDWEAIGEPLVQLDGSLEFEDANAGKFPGRFYRIKQLPR